MDSRNQGSEPLLINDEHHNEGVLPNSRTRNGNNSGIDLENDGVNGNNQRKIVYSSTFSSQMRGLIKKNYALQSKQIGTNLCQVITPLVCLLLVYLIKFLASRRINNTPTEYVTDFPYMLNIPYQYVYNNLFKGATYYVPSCVQWYLYETPENDQTTNDYVNQMFQNLIPKLNDGTPLDYFYTCSYNGTKKVMPFFTKPVNGSINNQIYGNLEDLNRVPLSDTKGTNLLPDGAITFNHVDDQSLSFKIQINDNRISNYHRSNGVTKISIRKNGDLIQVPRGQLALLDLMSKSYLRTITNQTNLLSGLQSMPISQDTSNLLNMIFSLIGATLYPIALSLMLPVFMYVIVLEKEERLQEMMKMNGLKMRYYWLINYLWNLIMYCASVTVFILFGQFVLEISFFTETGTGPMLVMLFGWGLSQVSLSFFWQNFIGKARSATIAGYLVAIWTTIAGISFNLGIWPSPQTLPSKFLLYPPFAFCRIVYDFSIRCQNNSCVKSFSDFTPQMKDCLISLYVGAVAYMVLAMYLNEVLPHEYGIRKHPLFFLGCFKRKSNETKMEYTEISLTEQVLRKSVFDQESIIELDNEDDDVLREKSFVRDLEESSYAKYPLVIKNIRKVYKPVGGKPAKVAVRNLSLHIKKGEIFGLLGPNGAGKTTLISMITGLYPPESGNAWVSGYNIIQEIEYARSNMGVCPQFDLLWPDLTVEEHLYFYARMRGVPEHAEKELVEKAINEVYLTKFAQFKVRQLSGGMKRRLSVAISLVGDPKIVFLDEPTTGLDPENRRQLWDILVEARGDRAMVLTTHSMEEADVLCNRIGIITNGVLRCVGPQTRLKSLYGGGYHLFINCHKDILSLPQGTSMSNSLEQYHKKVEEVIPQILPKATLKSSFNGNFVFLIPLEGLQVSRIFEELEARKAELAIADWGISQSTLEDVFLEIIGTSENADAEQD